jgi:molybdate transport system substrate-binding protein
MDGGDKNPIPHPFGENPLKRIIALTILLAVFLTSCGTAATPIPVSAPATQPATVAPTSAPTARTLTVFAAASLTQAFGEISKAFEAANSGVTVTLNFANSQTLQTQIQQGAPADIFASASGTNMDAVVTGGFVAKDSSQIFITNKLVVILPANNPGNVQSLQDLSRSGVKVVLGDTAVPAGKYARQILDNISKDPSYGTDYGTKVLANVVSNENDVKQVVAKVQLGEADAGIVYLSDSIAAPDLKTIEIPANLNVIAKYPIAPLIKSGDPDLAAQFVAYVLSADGQAILQKWGFSPIK